MALPPKFAAHRLEFGKPPQPSSAVPASSHTLEIYLDYCCPFSAKFFRHFQDTVVPMIRANPSWSSLLNVIFRQQIQPWHPSSTLMHEAALAVLHVAPEKFWDYSRLLFDHQTEYFDVPVVNEVRNDTYKRLAKLAGQAGVDEAKVLDMLRIPEKAASDGALNAGNAVSDDVKITTKMNRLVGVHVTPTCIFDGVVQSIESSWTAEQWKEWLGKNVV